MVLATLMRKQVNLFHYLRYLMMFVFTACLLAAVWNTYRTNQVSLHDQQLNDLNNQRTELIRSVVLLPISGLGELREAVTLSSDFRSNLLSLPHELTDSHDGEAVVSLKLGGGQFVDLADAVLAGGYTVVDLASEMEQLYHSEDYQHYRPTLDKIAAFFFMEVFGEQRNQISIDNAGYQQFIAEIEAEIRKVPSDDRQTLKEMLKTLSPMVARHSQYQHMAESVLTHHFNNQLVAYSADLKAKLEEYRSNQILTWFAVFLSAGIGFIASFYRNVIVRRNNSHVFTSDEKMPLERTSKESQTAQKNSLSKASDGGLISEDLERKKRLKPDELSVPIGSVSASEELQNSEQQVGNELGSTAHEESSQSIDSWSFTDILVSQETDAQGTTEVTDSGEERNAEDNAANVASSPQAMSDPHPMNEFVQGNQSPPSLIGPSIQEKDLSARLSGEQVMPEPDATPASFDVSYMLDAFDDDTDAVNMLLGVFVDEHSEDSEQLFMLIASGNLIEAERLVHSIKGVSGSLGAAPLNKVASQLEQAFKQGDDYSELVNDFVHQLKLLTEEIRLHLNVGAMSG